MLKQYQFDLQVVLTVPFPIHSNLEHGYTSGQLITPIVSSDA
ncbi:hypothetical protein RintRC_2926 [Richelia intracellularis]|nr:hypothetical protein RintRC_2926 [Richelia intracellularis]